MRCSLSLSLWMIIVFVMMHLLSTESKAEYLRSSYTITKKGYFLNYDIYINKDNELKEAVMFLTGPMDRWYAIGLGNLVMKDTYALIAQKKQKKGFQENILDEEDAGVVIPQSTGIDCYQNYIRNGYRTLIIKSDIKLNKYFEFPDKANAEISMISSVGREQNIATKKHIFDDEKELKLKKIKSIPFDWDKVCKLHHKQLRKFQNFDQEIKKANEQKGKHENDESDSHSDSSHSDGSHAEGSHSEGSDSESSDSESSHSEGSHGSHGSEGSTSHSNSHSDSR